MVEIKRGEAYGQYQYVDVTFGAANTDKLVRHDLKPATASQVDYQVVRRDRDCQVYENTALDARPWGINFIVLRCTAASAVVTLLLTTRS